MSYSVLPLCWWCLAATGMLLRGGRIKPYLSQGFYSCTNNMTKKQAGGWGMGGRVYSAYSSKLLFIIKGGQDWNSSRSGNRS